MSSVSPGSNTPRGMISNPRHQQIINKINANANVTTTPGGRRKLANGKKNGRKEFIIPDFSLLLTTNIPDDIKNNRKKLIDAIQAQLPPGCKLKEIRKTRKGDIAIAAASEHDYNKLLGTENWTGAPFTITPRLDITNDASTAYIKPYLEGDEIKDFEDVLNSLGVSFSSLSQVKVAGKPIGTLRVQIHKKSELESLIKNKVVVNYLGRTVEPHAENNIIQCFQCQQFGHLQTDCQEEQRCLRCGDTGHGHKSCPKPKEEEKCANCALDHIASYKGCKIRLSYVRNLRRNSNENFIGGARTSGTSSTAGSRSFSHQSTAQASNGSSWPLSSSSIGTYLAAASGSSAPHTATAPHPSTLPSASVPSNTSSTAANLVTEDHLEACFRSLEDRFRQNASDIFDITIRSVLETITGSNPNIVIHQEPLVDSVIRQVSKRSDLFDVSLIVRRLYTGSPQQQQQLPLFPTGCHQPQRLVENSTGTATAPFQLSSVNGAVRKGSSLETQIKPLMARGPYIDPTYPPTANTAFKHHGVVDSPRKRKRLQQQHQQETTSSLSTASIPPSLPLPQPTTASSTTLPKTQTAAASAAAMTSAPSTISTTATTSTAVVPQTSAPDATQHPPLQQQQQPISTSSAPTPATTAPTSSSTSVMNSPKTTTSAAMGATAAATVAKGVNQAGMKLLTPSKVRQEANAKGAKTLPPTASSAALTSTTSTTTANVVVTTATKTPISSLAECSTSNVISSTLTHIRSGTTASTADLLSQPNTPRPPPPILALSKTIVNDDMMASALTADVNDFRSTATSLYGDGSWGWASSSLYPISGSPTIQQLEQNPLPPTHPCLLYGNHQLPQQLQRQNAQDQRQPLNHGL